MATTVNTTDSIIPVFSIPTFAPAQSHRSNKLIGKFITNAIDVSVIDSIQGLYLSLISIYLEASQALS